MTTKGASISRDPIYTKRGERFTVTINLPVRTAGVWTGVTGYSQIRDANDALVYDFGTVTGVVNGDATASLTFDAAGTDTALWPEATYFVDFMFKIGSSYGPRKTQTYKLVVSDGPTNP